MLFTNNGQEIKTIKSRQEFGGYFDGIFASEGETSCHVGDYVNHIEVADELVASTSDLDDEIALQFLENKYPEFNEGQISLLMDICCYQDTDEWEHEEELSEMFPGLEMYEISFECQNIRGLIALNQGYSAVEMEDEYGISYFIMAGGEYKIV
jgi:hypothetical protein